MMRFLFLPLFAAGSMAFAGSAGEATGTPDVVAKMVQGLGESKIEHLTSQIFQDGPQEYSYHLKTISYLGTVTRDGRIFTIAEAKFIRSSPKGREDSPARGHSFLIVFDDQFKVATHGRFEFDDYHMDGDVMKLGDVTVIDFGSTKPEIRHHGWLVEGAFMPYPFADRISDADWESGAFRKER